MPTRRQIRQARTKAAILRAARELSHELGFERVSLRAIAKRVEYSPAALYEYFDDKDDLLAALCEETQASLLGAMRDDPDRLSAEEANDPQAELVALGLAYVRFALANAEDFQLLFSRLGNSRRGLAQPVPTGSPYQLVLTAARKARAKGELPFGDGIDPEHVAYAIWATAHGMAMLRLTHLAGFEADFDAADRDTLAALVAGFGVGGLGT